MFRFGEVAHLYNVVPYSDGRILEIRTDKGYATLDCKKMHVYPSTTKVGIPAYYFVEKERTLYLMKEEPQYYA